MLTTSVACSTSQKLLIASEIFRVGELAALSTKYFMPMIKVMRGDHEDNEARLNLRTDISKENEMILHVRYHTTERKRP